ncbi:putative uncharacterized protein DDB_G0290521 [Haliotis asinina]|uniref:putative uncharacterized protein DDB_G0290521 n=1 Tax=Haliotis asinina TaxID=109174 RepID=UPI00353230B4
MQTEDNLAFALPSQQDSTSTSQDPTPSISQDPTPTTNQDPTPTTSQDPTPTTNQDPAPTTSQDPTPTTYQDPTPTTSQDPTRTTMSPAPVVVTTDILNSHSQNILSERKGASSAQMAQGQYMIKRSRVELASGQPFAGPEDR